GGSALAVHVRGAPLWFGAPRGQSHGRGSKTYYRQLRIDPLAPENANELLDALLGTSSREAGGDGLAAQRAPARLLPLDRGADIVVPRIIQGAQEGDQRRLLVGAEEQWPEQRRKVGVWSSAAIIELNDVLERGKAPIVHIGSSARHVA